MHNQTVTFDEVILTVVRIMLLKIGVGVTGVAATWNSYQLLEVAYSNCCTILTLFHRRASS